MDGRTNIQYIHTYIHLSGTPGKLDGSNRGWQTERYVCMCVCINVCM